MDKDQENHELDSITEDDQDSEGAETVASPGGSADKPQRVKFKLPNMKESLEEEDMKDCPKVKDHCCVECIKRFSSGKALGGHMSSAHSQASRDFSLKRPKSKTKRPLKQLLGSDSLSGYGGKYICNICGRGFVTNKSLFGHMRSHPEREWRGMEPPAEAARNFPQPEFSHVLDGDQIDSGSAAASAAASAAVGFNESVKWQVTGKRGRAPTKPVIDLPPLPSSKEILAVQQLIRLVNGDSTKPGEDLDSKVKEGEATNSNSWTPEDETDDVNQNFQLIKNTEKVFPVEDERDSPLKKLKIWEITDEDPGGAQVMRILQNIEGKQKLNPENSISSDYSSDKFGNPKKYGINGSMIIKNMTTEEKKPVDAESPPNFSPIEAAAESVLPAAPPADYKYICSNCGKSFTTPQALGGHKSSHKKLKVKVYNTIDDQSSIGASYAKDRPKANAIKQLEVNIALGVKNPCHCSGECNHADHVTSTDEAKKERKILEFDLNENLNQDDRDGMEPGNTAS